ncbi:GDP-L-fucose synthase [Nitrosotalea sinensis]|uniref:GDP-L-fucose synthase n=1 Tax=Nitrosotalea sinensis TaxID=1499975 RepID=A0A2H1EF32_9ARCH|nr:GDP-L-fucose synthase [Candidatus Nitrosotalea sinensis]SHO42823.1 GDP-L-fucose synthase [Candidatus Nitrosotalea sinensis]
MNLIGKKIVVTGGSGFLGSQIVKMLQEKGISDIIVPRSIDCDLRIPENCSKITKGADIVFHTAGNVGGIGYNKEHPASVFYDNIMMDTLMIEESRKNKVEKFIAIGTVCSYPKFVDVPFSEEQIWSGYPEETNASYGLSKKMMLVQSESYRQEYNFNSIVLVQTNLYGPGDNFDPNTSHVIPALIKKIHDAKNSNISEIEIWGDGTPSRDFLYVDDAARAAILAAERYEKSEPINIGSGNEVTIKELAEILIKLMNVKSQVVWNKQKPNGQPRRCLSIEKARREIGFEPQVRLEEGLKRTIEWYELLQDSSGKTSIN